MPRRPPRLPTAALPALIGALALAPGCSGPGESVDNATVTTTTPPASPAGSAPPPPASKAPATPAAR